MYSITDLVASTSINFFFESVLQFLSTRIINIPDFSKYQVLLVFEIVGAVAHFNDMLYDYHLAMILINKYCYDINMTSQPFRIQMK